MPANDTTHSQFDVSAPKYDAEFTDSAIGKMQRERVHFVLQVNKLVSGKSKVLEINCGTGADAIWLAQKGNMVIASDASVKMIEQCSYKHKSSEQALELQFVKSSFSELKETFPNQKFDLIFSNFGGLNCVDTAEFKQLFSDFSQLLLPNGKMVLVVMGRRCVWEQLYFLLKGNPQKAFRRISKQAIAAHLGDGTYVSTYYYSPAEVLQLANGNFKQDILTPIGFFVPPSYLGNFFANKKNLLKILYFFEKVIFNWKYLADYSDHYLLILSKKA